MQISKYPPLIDRRNYLPPPLQVFHILVSCFLCGQFHGIGGVGRGAGGGSDGGRREGAMMQSWKGFEVQSHKKIQREFIFYFLPLAGPAAALS